MGKKGETKYFVVTTHGSDGACAAAMALQAYPRAEIVITSTSRAPGAFDEIAGRIRPEDQVLICGLGVDDSSDETLAALRRLCVTGVEAIWFCGRGYLDAYAPEIAAICLTHFGRCASNTESLFRLLSIQKDKRATFLLDLAHEFVRREEAASPEHRWWHDFIQAAAGRFFKYDDGQAFASCIRKLAGQEEVTPKDEREVERWRAYSGKALPLGHSPAMKRLRKMIAGLAPVQEPVLICGPSGSGKEMVARLLHEASPRSDGPFIPVNCAILSTNADLAHDRLFGHRAGAYTGATSGAAGAFEAADDGTLFLDEVGELPLEAQTQLLRVLEEGTILPLGTMETQAVNVRVVAATHRDLPAMIEDGAFRLDLYHRLSVLVLDVPALKDRREDMKSIANAVAHQLKAGGYALRISKADWTAAEEYDWPGNIRQLINLLKRSAYTGVTLAEAIREERHRFAGRGKAVPARSFDPSEEDLFHPASADAITPEVEVRKAYMQRCLELCDNNWTLTASRLGVAINTLRKWLG